LWKFYLNNFKTIIPDEYYLFTTTSNGRLSSGREIIAVTAADAMTRTLVSHDSCGQLCNNESLITMDNISVMRCYVTY